MVKTEKDSKDGIGNTKWIQMTIDDYVPVWYSSDTKIPRVFLKLVMLCFTLMWVNTKHIQLIFFVFPCLVDDVDVYICICLFRVKWTYSLILSLVIVIGHCSFWRLLGSGLILQFAPFPNSTHPNFSKRGRIFLSQISSSRISPISFLGFFMWVKQCHKPPMTGGW